MIKRTPIIFTFQLSTAASYCILDTLHSHQQSLEKASASPSICAASTPSVLQFKMEQICNFIYCGGCVGHLGHLLRYQMALVHWFFACLGEVCFVNLKSHLSRLRENEKKINKIKIKKHSVMTSRTDSTVKNIYKVQST